MKKLIIGIVLVLFGVPGTSAFFPHILELILGALPLLLILGGGLAVYLGVDEVRSQRELTALDPVPEPIQEPPLQSVGMTVPDPSPTPETPRPPAPRPTDKPTGPDAEPENLELENSEPEKSEPEKSEPTKPAPEAPSGVSSEPTDANSFAGNTDSFVFHSLSCAFSKGKKCTALFTTREEAMEQGYKPCKICNP